MIAVIDSGIANVGSVLAALHRIGAPAHVTRSPSEVESAPALVLPGVGAFRDGMNSLRAYGLLQPIRQAAQRGTPILGICLGMQLLAEASEEFGEHEGLGLIRGRVVRLEPQQPGERVPNIGWCDVRAQRASRLLEGVDDRSAFYFVHSYSLRCTEPHDAVASFAFGAGAVTAVVEREHIFGTQFHPEKSQDAGLTVLHNYARLAETKQ
jgi:glutamine amidotransferase